MHPLQVENLKAFETPAVPHPESSSAWAGWGFQNTSGCSWVDAKCFTSQGKLDARQKNIAAESLKCQGMPFSPYNSSNLVRTASSLDTPILEKCYQCHLSIELRLFNFLQWHEPWSPWTKPSFEKPRHPWWPAVPSSNDTANWGPKKCKWGREWNPTTWEQTHL